MKYTLLTLLFILSIGLVNAVAVEKPLLNVSNCYNLTITADLERGVETPIYFTGCTKTDTNKWFCDCFKVDKTDYLLVMWTDNTILRDERRYQIDIDAQVYNYNLDNINFRVDDWGDYIDLGRADLTHIGDNIKTIKVPEIIYINKTIYEDRIINDTIYQDVINTVYIENTTQIELLNNNITELNNRTSTLNKDVEKYKGRNVWLMWSLIILITILIICLNEIFG